MSTIGIEPDNIASTGQVVTTTASGASGNFWDYMALATSASGPVVEQSYLAAGNEGAASIAAATANATYSSAITAAGDTSYLSTGGLGSSYSTAYYTGTSPYTTTYSSYDSSGDLATDVESILTETATSQAYLIGIQAQMGQQQATFTAISNALNVKTSMEREAIRNFKA